MFFSLFLVMELVVTQFDPNSLTGGGLLHTM